MAKEDNNPKGVYINELLCFITNKIDVVDPTILVQVCVETYKANEIVKAKELLFELLKDENDVTKFIKRNHRSDGEKKEAKDMNDIIQYLQEKGTKNWPQFVALDLSKLPPITLDKTDYSVLLTKMQKLQTAVDMMRVSVETQYEISDSLKTSNEKLQERVEQIEIKSNEVNVDINVSKEVIENPVFVEKILDEPEPLSCLQCDFKCDELDVLEMHIKRGSCRAISKTNILKNNTSIPNTDLKTDKRKDPAKVHIQLFECSECEFKFVTKAGLDAHAVTHAKKSGINLECHECKNRFNSNDELDLHMQLHQQQKLFTCPDCGYTDSVRDRLTVHMRSHCREKQQRSPFPRNVRQNRNSVNRRNDSVNSVNCWDTFNIDEVARKYFMDSFFNSDGFSAPFKNGKPVKLNDLQDGNVRGSKGWPKRKPVTIGTAKGSAGLALKKSNYQATVFASRYSPSVSEDTVKSDLERNLKEITNVDHDVRVERLETRYEFYASFKITCLCPNTAVFMNPEIWPEGCLFRWWRNPRNDNARFDTRNNY